MLIRKPYLYTCIQINIHLHTSIQGSDCNYTSFSSYRIQVSILRNGV